MNVFVTGVNFRTVNIDILERLFVKETELGDLLEHLMATGDLREAVLLSTCNRVELYAVPGNRPRSSDPMDHPFSTIGDFPCSRISGLAYTFHGSRAVSHLFRVASGIDSMVVGEPQITGQVKKAFEIARMSNSTGKVLNYLFQKAFSVAKTVRTETELSRGSVSIASVCVKRAKEIFPDFSRKSALLIGAGEMAERSAFHLRNNQLGTLYVYNRNRDRAHFLADKYGGTAVSGILEHLASPDIIIVSTSSPDVLLTSGQILEAMEKRKDRPLLILDIRIPRNVDPQAGGIDNVNLINIDDLRQTADDNKIRREQELRKAERIIQEKVDSVISRFHRSIQAVDHRFARSPIRESAVKEEL